MPTTWTTTVAGGPASTRSARSRSGTSFTSPGAARGVRIIHTQGSVPATMPTSAALRRHASRRVGAARTRASSATSSTVTGTATSVASSTSPHSRHTCPIGAA
ncbi:hypothetical protein [Micromonospora sp. CPCC 205739]|uniref:hypothetical protein n=1 Tax=Micromonospora sp. CPCC 205739 TaxID=3122404 RepID=UPI002FF0EFA7